MKLDNTGRAMVADTTHWVPITPEHEPPLGAKVLVINRSSGVAALDTYSRSRSWLNQQDPRRGWTHYSPLPTFRREE